MARNIKGNILMFSKAQVSAGIATFADYCMRVVLDLGIGIGYIPATFLGAVTGGIVNCCINYKYVFDSGSRKKKSVAMRYILIWCGSVFWNTTGTAFFKEQCGIKAYYSMILTSILVAIFWNYIFQKHFVFKKK